MGSWKPEPIDEALDDVPESTREFFRERAPDSISYPGGEQFIDLLSDHDTIDFQGELRQRETRHQSDEYSGLSPLHQQTLDLASEYSYAVPTEEALALVADHEPIVELFAGNGYWAYELRNRGTTVHAYDANPPHDPWTTVKKGTQDALLEHREGDSIALLLCWPPVGPAAYEAVLVSHPERIFFVGEQPGDGFQMMADEKFFQLLEGRYELQEVVDLPNLPKHKDRLRHYELVE